MDIGTQAAFHSVKLLCPVQKCTAADLAVLSSRIEVIDWQRANFDRLVKEVDLLQLPGNFGWRMSRTARRLLRLAKRHGKPTFLGISSNRARTAWLNRRKGLIGTAKGLLRWLDVRTSQRFLARRSSGVFVVGRGIKNLGRPNPNIHVSTASWIDSRDIFERPASRSPPIRICCAARLEPMKGIDLGVHAVGELASVCGALLFDIVGDGPERSLLEEAVERAGIHPITRFLGQLAYPGEFLSYLRSVDFVLLTNLNDEQPRVIFDAISQGCLPICPDSSPYRALGLDERLLYDRGRPDRAAAAILRFISMDDHERRNIESSLRSLEHDPVSMKRIRSS